MNHLVWPDDENESLCGKDVSQAKWNDAVNCSECVEINDFLSILEKLMDTTGLDIKDALPVTVAVWGQTHE